MTVDTTLHMGHAQPHDLAEAQPFDAFSNQTLLQAMESGGVDWPSSCRNGTCRTCLGQLLTGEVAYRVDWPGLSPEEHAAQCVLPCVAEPRSDVRLRYLGPFGA